ncbi:hypothetical protein P691DRAFT_811451 [Macrolepiota fuliginosa MF-IS2]|uniref:Uncharacterized protein n=1 Tax=Macrolepiota fuliginosa MF-IS2 TaxID=1400762 RepID=A0A9P6C5K2_9AGAR|nr:hypothetical protein P691DRAFT_811451 [Macrolepiota fuliginosa MF-IS2]
MTVSGLTRSLPVRLSRSFTTSSTNASPEKLPLPPRRKGRTPRVNPKTQPLLPPHKLRALVSLYHQSDDFITHENLLERIDAAFLHGVSEQYRSVNRIRHEFYDNLLVAQRSVPRVSPWNLETVSTPTLRDGDNYTSASWSGTIVGRERQIIDALYGVESPRPDGRPLPGYDTLMEARELKQKQKVE